MKIHKSGNIWYAESTYAEKDVLKGAGFWWNPDKKYWWTKSAEVAAKLSRFAQEDVSLALDKLASEKSAALISSRAIDFVGDFPAPEGLNYFPFQKAGIAYAMNRGNSLIADEMGLGKTIQAIGVINTKSEIKTVFVICPASVKINWKRELEKWLVRKTSIAIANASDNAFPGANIVIINYDILEKYRDAILAVTWDLLICDEVHYCKSMKTRRTKATREISKKAKQKIFLTGTPVLNRPIELFPVLNMINPKEWSSYWDFAKRYAGAYRGKFGWVMTGASNLEELQNKLRATTMIRRLKKDVLKELPAKVRKVIEIPQNGFSSLIAKEQGEERKWYDLISQIEAEVDNADAEENQERYKVAMGKLRGVKNAMFNQMAILRHETALAKVPEAINFVTELLESQDKVIVYAHHHDVIAQLKQGLIKFSPVVLTGENSQQERQKSIDSFQQDSSCRIFIGSITAAGLGITLTAASTEVFVELDWVPANITQAEDRAHRIGQLNSVLVYHLVIDGSLDSKLARAIIAKQQVADKVLDVLPERSEDDEIFEGIEELEKKREKKKSTLVPVEDSEELKKIHAQLKFMSQLDKDRATQVNGVGFNKYDGVIGHELAERMFLTPKQGALAKKILGKYKRQLEAFDE